MAKVLINEDYLTDIADAIRYKRGVSTKYKPKNMATAIRNISVSSGGSFSPATLYDNTHSMTSVDFASGRITAAFAGSTALTEASCDGITVEPIPYSFANCSNLETFNITDDYNLYAMEGMFLNCASLVNLTNDAGMNSDRLEVIVMGDKVFAGCSSLAHVEVVFEVSGVVDIFKDCSNLARVDIEYVPSGTWDLYSIFGTGITNLKTVVLDDSISTSRIVWKGDLPSDLYFYVSSSNYNSWVSNGSATLNGQFRKIEDYPELEV